MNDSISVALKTWWLCWLTHKFEFLVSSLTSLANLALAAASTWRWLTQLSFWDPAQFQGDCDRANACPRSQTRYGCTLRSTGYSFMEQTVTYDKACTFKLNSYERWIPCFTNEFSSIYFVLSRILGLLCSALQRSVHVSAYLALCSQVLSWLDGRIQLSYASWCTPAQLSPVLCAPRALSSEQPR